MIGQRLRADMPVRASLWLLFWAAVMAGSLALAAAWFGWAGVLVAWFAAGGAYNFRDVVGKWEKPKQQQRLGDAR